MSVINQLNATTEYYWMQTEAEDIVNKASALLWKLMQKAVKIGNWEIQPHETVDGGLMIKVPLEYQASNAGAYGATTTINQSKVDIVDAARFRWAGIYGSNTLNLDDLTQNTGAEAVISLTNQYMKSIKKAARTNMAAAIIAEAADSNSINGLGDLFNASTSTEYGSIDEAEMATWAAKAITTVEALDFECLQKIFREVAMGDFAGMLPNFCCTTTVLKDGYERSLQTQQRFTGDEKMAEAGWDNLRHKGAAIVADAYYDASYTGYFDALNLNFLSLRSHKDYNFTAPKWISKEVLGQPDVLTANTRWRGNLFCSSRRMHVRHTGLTAPA